MLNRSKAKNNLDISVFADRARECWLPAPGPPSRYWHSAGSEETAGPHPPGHRHSQQEIQQEFPTKLREEGNQLAISIPYFCRINIKISRNQNRNRNRINKIRIQKIDGETIETKLKEGKRQTSFQKLLFHLPQNLW